MLPGIGKELKQALTAPRFWRIGRLILVMGLVILGLLNAAAGVRAVQVSGEAAAPRVQDPGYPTPESVEPTEGYPQPENEETPVGYPTAGEEIATPIITPTQTLTPTLAPDIFRTEDAEIGESQVTPSGSETPGFTPTPVNTVTPTTTMTATPEPIIAAAEDEGFNIDWGLFSIGFAIPVLIGCGIVLYFLDRRPDLFSPHRK
jgi:hypothetical protein